MIAIFHFAAVVHYYFGMYYLFAEVAEKDMAYRKYRFGGVWIYLTYINFVSCMCDHIIKRVLRVFLMFLFVFSHSSSKRFTSVSRCSMILPARMKHCRKNDRLYAEFVTTSSLHLHFHLRSMSLACSGCSIQSIVNLCCR